MFTNHSFSADYLIINKFLSFNFFPLNFPKKYIFNFLNESAMMIGNDQIPKLKEIIIE